MKNISNYTLVIALVAVVTIFAGASVYAREATSTRQMMNWRSGHATSTRPMMRGDFRNASSTRGMSLGRPVVGTIATISGTSFTLTTSNSQTFTVDASSARIVKRGDTSTPTPATSTISDLVVGQNVIVLGNVSTSTQTISAKQIMIGGPMGAPGQLKSQENGNQNQPAQASSTGFFSKIGRFFGRLFGR